jgi:hypothetical protein
MCFTWCQQIIIYLTLFYRIVWNIVGSGNYRLTNVTMFGLFISCGRPQNKIIVTTIKASFGIKKFRWQFLAFAWRLFRNRIPTEETLVRRGIIQSNLNTCINGCGQEETIDHLFFGWNVFGSLWFLVRHWRGISSVKLLQLSNHVLQFRTLFYLPLTTY